MLTAHGKTLCLSDWARELGISRAALQWRLDAGWSVEKALSKTGRRLRKSLIRRRGPALSPALLWLTMVPRR